MGHDDFVHDLYDSYPRNFISQSHLEPLLDGLATLSKKNEAKQRFGSFYTPTYARTTTSIDDGQSSTPLSQFSFNNDAGIVVNESIENIYNPADWSSHSHSSDVLSSPDSSSPSPYLSYIDELWSPESATTEPDDDTSLASSVASLSPNSDLDTFPAESIEGEDDDDFYSSPAVSLREESLYHSLEQYPLHSSPHERSAYHDDDLSPLTFSPPALVPLHLLSLSELGHQPTIKKPSSPSPPLQYDYHSFFDYDSSIPVPSSPSRRRSSTLPELEPTTYNTDLFGLHKSIPSDVPDMRWRSFPGCETDDDLIPVELASKNYIPDPSVIAPTTSTGRRSLLLSDQDLDDRSDFPIPRSPSPENFYLDPTILAECGDEELRKVYELRQRTAKSEKWERERCRELSALLRLKLDERGVLGGTEGGDCGNHQSGSRSLPCCTNLPYSSSPSSDSLTVYQPRPEIPSSSSSTLPLTPAKQQPQPEGPKHKIRSMAQLVASMLFNRQSDTLRRHPSRKAGFATSRTSSHSSHSSHCSPPSTMGGSGMKVPSTPKSRLSKVILPEVDSEERQGMGVEVKMGDEAEEEKDMNMDVDVDVESLSRSCSGMDSNEGGLIRNGNSHAVTWAAPPYTLESTQ